MLSPRRAPGRNPTWIVLAATLLAFKGNSNLSEASDGGQATLGGGADLAFDVTVRVSDYDSGRLGEYGGSVFLSLESMVPYDGAISVASGEGIWRQPELVRVGPHDDGTEGVVVFGDSPGLSAGRETVWEGRVVIRGDPMREVPVDWRVYVSVVGEDPNACRQAPRGAEVEVSVVVTSE